MEKILRRVDRIKDMERQLAALSVGGTQPVPDLQSPTQLARAPISETDPDGESPSRPTFIADEVRARLDVERGQLRAPMDLLRLHTH